MPIPVCGGSVETLRSFLNVQSDADFVLIVTWALACLRKRGPYRYRALGRTGFTQPAGANLVVRPLRFPSKRNVLGTQRQPTEFAFHWAKQRESAGEKEIVLYSRRCPAGIPQLSRQIAR